MELTGRILTPEGLVRGRLRFGERIEEIVRDEVDGPLILPGFIDVHVHGGDGGDTMDGAEGVRRMARFHVRHGTTTILPTTITNPWERVLAALDGVAQVRREPAGGLPDVHGAHLEGPFISPERLGAQPPFALEPRADLVEEILARDVVRVVTLAPELPGAPEAARAFALSGVRVSLGHTAASYEEVSAVAEAVWAEDGTLGFTHLYNAMGGLAGRSPGVVGAAFAKRRAWAELIYDGHHVADGSLHAAREAKRNRLMMVSDCIRAGGMAEGETELGGQKVLVERGAARLVEGGALAGSVLTLDRALRNLLAAGVPLAEASWQLSGAPARYLGLADRGELALGRRADLVTLDREYRVTGVHVAGAQVAGGDAVLSDSSAGHGGSG